MRNSRMLIAGALIGSSLVLGLPAAQADMWDLAADWSDAVNPNNPWSYNAGSSPIATHQDAWNPGDFVGGQPAWSTALIPAWFQRDSSVYQGAGSLDLLLGDVAMHGSGTADFTNVTWTSPTDFVGQVAVSGGVWMARDIDRAMDWRLFQDGTLLDSGHIASGDEFSRANPDSFLLDISIAAGDVIMLEFQSTVGVADFAGVDMEIHGTPIPAPGAVLLAMMGLPLVGWVKRWFA